MLADYCMGNDGYGMCGNQYPRNLRNLPPLYGIVPDGRVLACDESKPRLKMSVPLM